MTADRRRWKRLNSNMFAVVRSPGTKEKMGRGIVIDVNVHGFGIETEMDMTVGDIFEFDVEIPFTLKAKVVRSIVPGQMKQYGLQLVGQGFFDRLLLKKLLEGKRNTDKIE